MARMLEGDVWTEVLQARRERHLLDPARSPETWRADEQTKWRAALAEARASLDAALTPGDPGDPRDALVRLIGVCSSWIAAVDNRPGVR